MHRATGGGSVGAIPIGGRSRRTIGLILTVGCVLLVTTVTVAATPVSPPWRFRLPWSGDFARVTVGDVTVQAEVADTGSSRQRGLGYRDGLEPGTGMLFVFDESAERSFWMRGMRFCLDIIWIERGEVVGAATDVCPVPGAPESELRHYVSPVPVTYVLEVPAGWLAENGLSVGSPVDISLE